VDELRPGLYEDVITERLATRLAKLGAELVQKRRLEPAEADAYLSRYVALLVRRALASRGGASPENVQRVRHLANALIEAIYVNAPDALDGDDEIDPASELLLAVMRPSTTPMPPSAPERPDTPLTSSALLVNGTGQPRLGLEIIKELASAESVDLISAFIKWHGFRVVEKALRELVDRGGRLRIITTTYIGATDRRAIDALVDLGAEVRVSYDTRMTRLHAKAWLFRRGQLSTAYIGSSNLSRSALLDGLEWNVRISRSEQPHLVDTFAATFDDYWDDPSFELYDPAADAERFDESIIQARGLRPADMVEISPLHVRPYPFQQEVLDQLDAERKVHGRMKSLVVMATGTGKTVVSALDYLRLRDAGTVDTLLFVAHRKEILDQSRRTFRNVLRAGDFGERYVDGEIPSEWRHVFASVQSLAQLDLRKIGSDHFSMVIVDEFHHAEAPTYERLLSYLQPKLLVGLTATPERTDGKDVRSWFDGRIAVELRLWEALERGLLSPFQYFGIADDVDVSGVAWSRGRYDQVQLAAQYVANRDRAAKVIAATRAKVEDVSRMRALGFCVSVEHARFMASEFRAAGIPSIAISADSDAETRREALVDLGAGRVQCVFAVDLFNEGIDVPAVDTVIFLRPTESATVFLQQLGRGLRLSDEKACLTVLDFIGHQHTKFRFDRRYRALTGASRRAISREIEGGFPVLPAGCHIELDRVAREIVLENVQRALHLSWKDMAAELRSLGPVDLRQFLDETMLELEDVYRDRNKAKGWLGLQRAAGHRPPVAAAAGPQPDFRRMLHLDDPERLGIIAGLLDGTVPTDIRSMSVREQRLLTMLHFGLWGAGRSADEVQAGLGDLLASDARDELGQLAAVLQERMPRVTHKSAIESVPLRVHATYSRDEALAAFGVNNPNSVREGVKFVEPERADMLFVTLQKTEEHFSPTTMYRDRAVSPDVFQWESQSTTTIRSKTGQRYLTHDEQGSSIHLFVRETRRTALDVASPYLYAGQAHYQSHQSERPIEIMWRLERELPADVFHTARAVAG
jgi:DNA or RNA helicases of superfamily II